MPKKKERTKEEVVRDLNKKNQFSRKTARKFDLLSDLEMEQMDKLLRHRVVGQKEMARIIQEDWKKYEDVKRDTLAKRVQRYYNREIKVKDSILELVGNNNKELYEALNLNRANLDVVGELSDIYTKHKHLMNKQFKAIERASNPDMRKWNASVKEVVSMLRLITNTYMDVGIMERKPKQSQVHVHATSDKDELSFEASAMEQAKLEDSTKKVLEVLQGDYRDITDQASLPAPIEASDA